MSESAGKNEKLGIRDTLYVLGTEIDALAKRDATYGDAMRLGSLMAIAGAAFGAGAALGIHEKPHLEIDLALAKKALEPVMEMQEGGSAVEVMSKVITAVDQTAVGVGANEYLLHTVETIGELVEKNKESQDAENFFLGLAGKTGIVSAALLCASFLAEKPIKPGEMPVSSHILPAFAKVLKFLGRKQSEYQEIPK